MIDLAATISAMKQSGMTDGQIVSALSCIKTIQTVQQPRTARQERNARYYDARGISGREWSDMRALVLGAYSNHCVYCGVLDPTTVDHVVPVSKGGLSDTTNLVPCCHSCNSSKRDIILRDWLQ